MSEENSKVFTLMKVSAGEVMFRLSPVSNPNAVRIVHLTEQRSKQVLPLDWALGVVADQGNYELYKQGFVTFDDNDTLAKEAQKAGVWFDETFDFTPADPKDNEIIKGILKLGQRTRIEAAIEQYGKDRVRDIAVACQNDLSVSVVKVLEDIFKIQFIIDGE